MMEFLRSYQNDSNSDATGDSECDSDTTSDTETKYAAPIKRKQSQSDVNSIPTKTSKTRYFGLFNDSSESESDDISSSKSSHIVQSSLHQSEFASFLDDQKSGSNSSPNCMENNHAPKINENIPHANKHDILKSMPERPTGHFWSKTAASVDWNDSENIWCGHSSQTHAPHQKHGTSHLSHKLPLPQFGKGEKPQKQKVVKSCFHVHHNIAPLLNMVPGTGHKNLKNRIAHKCDRHLPGHAGAVNRINWSVPMYSHLLLSVSMDRCVKIWNVFSEENVLVKSLNHHTKAVKDAKWNHNGRQILSCSYDKTTCLLDVENGSCVRRFLDEGYVTCVQYHPVDHNLFVSGSSNHITAWDCRIADKPIRRFSYKDVFGQVQDMEFTRNGNELFSCNNLVTRDSSDRNIMAWDFQKGVVVSNQMYQERYTCCCLKTHPSEPQLLAQSQGDYIALFSTEPPYKMNKCKRFDGHKVVGYNIGMDISPNGKTLASGSSDGIVPFYDYHTTRRLGHISLGPNQICLDVKWHPLLPGRLAVCTWGGDIQIWK